jgi:predicted NBD/HSP70 family sugar kinase
VSSYRTGSSGMSRDLNRAAVLRLIGASGRIARNQIAQELGLSPATVTSVTRELINRGLIRVAERAPSQGGRPALLLELVGGAATAFGVKIAADHLVGVRVNLDAEVLERFDQPLDVTAPGSVERIGDLLAAWLGGGTTVAPLLGVGLGVPGVADARKGLVDSPTLGWRKLALAKALERRLRAPVLVDNDVNTLAVSERLYGRGRDVDNFLTVTLGRGVGLGIIAGGDIYRGFGGGAGEFGHVSAVPDGAVCSCGKRGCLETVVSDIGLVAAARHQKVISARAQIGKLRALADAGDQGAQAVYRDAGAVFGRAVADLVNLFSPQLVLVSGEGTQAWPHLAESFDQAYRHNLFAPLRGIGVEVDPWDDAKWAVGAAALVLRGTFTPLFDEKHAKESVRAWVRAEPRPREVKA